MANKHRQRLNRTMRQWKLKHRPNKPRTAADLMKDQRKESK